MNDQTAQFTDNQDEVLETEGLVNFLTGDRKNLAITVKSLLVMLNKLSVIMEQWGELTAFFETMSSQLDENVNFQSISISYIYIQLIASVIDSFQVQ